MKIVLNMFVTLTGFEPVTAGLENQCSIQLSYKARSLNAVTNGNYSPNSQFLSHNYLD